jgi:voltage-gated potassium channel
VPLPAHDSITSQRLYAGFLWSLVILLAILIIGTAGYRLIGGEKYTLLDCFYMTFITIATIGYGEIVDLSEHPGGRVFTMVIAMGGIAVMTYMTSIVTAFLVEGHISEALGRRRMEKHIHAPPLCGDRRKHGLDQRASGKTPRPDVHPRRRQR